MTCCYRNCKLQFIDRKNKKYCTLKCKRNEAKYRNRKNRKNNEK